MDHREDYHIELGCVMVRIDSRNEYYGPGDILVLLEIYANLADYNLHC